ncbi:hypothetical protein M0C34_07625 [Agarivorans sp. TSD2052]|uniref:DUF6602 domain-containing protein n=1 Tax=Agarivorans sp. TSD2052 TaxID=2937286 RepID=UPI00200E0C2B|nr:DUF6602 domain-containing protein [Agarivorans sp. TSD2052]UPW20121.1 hypothetical protein M0C34_07625 [Agarivorans sp. TSD2052]
MSIEQNFESYQLAISNALKLEQDRIRHLIGSDHWLTDGEHKEYILRDVISGFIPESYRVGSGFVCYPSQKKSSGQIDVLITSRNFPTLYKQGDLQFVTADATRAIIEVKTTISRGKQLHKVIGKLCDQIEALRELNSDCWCGLFIYDAGTLSEEVVLKTLQANVANCSKRVINCVSVGDKKFIRYWANGHPQSRLPRQPIWHAYNLKKLSAPYFISNLIAECSPDYEGDQATAMFPLRGEYGKERLKSYYAFLGSDSVSRFDERN